MRRRRAAVTVVAALAVLVLGAPAAQAAPAMVTTGSFEDGGYTIVVLCTGIVGAPVGDSVTVVGEVDAQAFAPKGVYVVGLAASCELYDRTTGVTYGKWSSALPGPIAFGVGTATYPQDADIGVKVCAAALFSDQHTMESCGTT